MGAILTDAEVFGGGLTLSDEEVFGTKKPRKMGKDAQGDFLRKELEGADWGTRQIAGFGTGLANLWEGAKQKLGQGDEQAIEANKIIADAAPVGAVLGEAALLAGPMGLVGNGVKAAGAIGAASGFMQPVQGEQSLGNIAKGTAINTALGGGLAAGGQAVANKVGEAIAGKLQSLALQKAQNAPRDAVLNDAIDLGLKVPPSSVNPTGLNTTLESMAGKIATAQTASNSNAKKFSDIARRELGLADDVALTPELLRGRRKLAYEVGYKPVENAGEVQTDALYGKALDDIVGKYLGPSKDFPGVADDSVRTFIEGKKKTVIPGKAGWVDEAGRDVGDVVEPKAPKIRSLLDELKKGKGISTSELGDIGEEFVNKNYPGLLRKGVAGVDKRGGNSADGLVEWMTSNGWMSDESARMADKSMPGGAQEVARDMIRTALKREPVIHPNDVDKWMSYSDEAGAWAKAGIRKSVSPDKEVGGLRVDKFDAGNALQMSRILRREASDAFRQGNSALGFAKKEAAQAIEDQVERGIASQGDGAGAKEALDMFREARKYIAKTHTVEGGILPGGSAFDPRRVPNRDFGKLDGDLKTAVAFAKNFPKASQSEAQVAGPAVNQLGALVKSGLGMAGGFAAGGPAAAAALAAAPFAIPPAVRAMLLSRLSQNALRDIYQLGLPARMAGSLGQNAPIGLTVLGLDTLGQ